MKLTKRFVCAMAALGTLVIPVIGSPKAPLPLHAVVNVLEPAGESNVRSSFALLGNHVLVGTEETADVYKSEDGGRSWRKTFDAGDAYAAQDVRSVIRAEDGSLYASTSGKGDILKSVDGGENWTLVNSIPAWRTVGIIQLSDGTFLTGARKDDSGETSIYRSEDGFQTLEHVALPNSVQQNVTCFHDLGGGKALAGAGFDGTAKVFKTEDSGRSWRLVADFEGTFDIFDFIKVDGKILTSTKSTATIYASADRGETWQPHFQVWEKGFLGTFDELKWEGNRYVVLSGTDQRDPERFRHCLLISRDGGETFEEWIELMTDRTGGASNVTVVNNRTIVVGTGNHSAQGRAFTITLDP
jgi:photosystem II stability/assembly factor-like uncharacterized protein